MCPKVALAVAGVVCAACAASATSQFKDTDCIPYTPPRGDRGPGSVFQYRDVQGKQIAYPVCVNLYDKDRSVGAGTDPEQQDKTNTYDVSLTASLLAGLVKDVDTPSANLSASNTQHVTVKWGATEWRYIPDEAKFDETGKVVPLSDSCAHALRDLKDADKLANVYMVQVALRVNSLHVTTDVNGSQGANADVSLKKLLDLKPSVKVTEKDSRTLDISEERYVCALPPILITDFVPKTGLSGESALLKGKNASLSEWKKLNAR